MTATDHTARTAHRSASMGDVAKVAGVSGQTVSRVVNGHTNVDDATRRRVLAAMDAVGYRPNRAARALRSGRFRTIGVIMFTLSSFGNMRTLDAIAMAATEADYAITLLPVAHPTQRDITGALSRLSEQAVDGVVILIEAHMLDRIDIVLPPGVPAVVIDSSADYPFPIVDTAQAEGARFATQHLLDLGHKTVWHIAGPLDSYSAGRRLDSWRATLEAHKAPVPEHLVGDWSAESGYTLGRTLAANPEVTAIFAANDQMALGVLRALHESGRAVPGDVSVVGFDDMDEAASFWPPLTTVHQDFARVGEHTVAALLAEIDGRPVPPHLDVPTTLIIRESSGPAPAA